MERGNARDLARPQDATVRRDFVSPDANPRPTIVISELMIDPTGVQNDREWIELWNYGATRVSLTNWTIADDNNSAKLTDPKLGIAPNARIVIGVSTNEKLNGGVAVAYAYPNNIGMDKSGEAITLYDQKLELVSRVSYGSDWPFGPGQSMSLVAGRTDTSLKKNWCAETIPWNVASIGGDKGSPGAAPKCSGGPPP